MNRLENFFNNHPIATPIIFTTLFLTNLLLASILAFLLFGSLPYLTYKYIKNVFEFAFCAVLYLIIIPFVFHLPNVDKSLKEYAKSIRLIPVKHLTRNIGIGLCTTAIWFASLFIYIILVSPYTFDLNTIVGSPWTYYELVDELTPGIWEEVAFRGILLTFLLKKYSDKKAIIIDSVVFGSWHFLNFLFGGQSLLETILQIMYATTLGIVFCYMFIKTESIIPGIILHYLIDAIGDIFFIILVILYDWTVIIFIILIVFLPEILMGILVKISTKKEEKPKINNS